MKVSVPGNTPMERLTNFAKKVVAVPKSEVSDLEKKWKSKRRPKARRKPAT